MTRRTRQWLCYAAYAANIGIILVGWWRGNAGLALNGYGILKAAGMLSGLLGAYSLLVQFLLMSRLKPLEQSFGLDRLARLHRLNGYATISLLAIHPLLLVAGFARGGSWLHQYTSFLFNYEWVLAADLALVLLFCVVGFSVYIVRKHLSYEAWYYAHLATYAAIFLAFLHQFQYGQSFAFQPLFKLYWWLLYVVGALVFGGYRILWPLVISYYQRFEVEKVVRETPDVVSIYLNGRHIDQLQWQAGQFAFFTFLTRELWWQAHPFSLSVAPHTGRVRITVKDSGDFTHQLPQLKPGTKVLLDGPYGVFRPEPKSLRPLLLIAGGIGITPLFAHMQARAGSSQSVTLLYAARTPADLALRSELEELTRQNPNVEVHYIVSAEAEAGMATGRIDFEKIKHFVPQWQAADILLCGPPAMITSLGAELRAHGLPSSQLFAERFDLHNRG